MATQTPERAAPLAVPPAPDPVAQTLALLQPWIDYVPQPQRRLGLFIFLAFLIQFGAFFFIRIDTTRAELRHEPRTHITVENSATPTLEGEAPGDDFWDRLTDPRLFLLPPALPGNPAMDDPALEFNAINTGPGTNELPEAVGPDDFQFVRSVQPPLEQRVAESMRPARQPFSYDEKARPLATRTTWGMDDALLQRQPGTPAALPSPISDTDLNPTQLLIAVGPGGAVEHVLVEQSARLDLDQLAVLAARKVRFQSTDQTDLTWGRLTVFWYYTPRPREEVVPTPPSAP